MSIKPRHRIAARWRLCKIRKAACGRSRCAGALALMSLKQFHIAISKMHNPVARRMLEETQDLYNEVCELDRTFIDRINANKAARGEGPTKLSKAKREKIAQYVQDAAEADEQLTRDFAKMQSGEIIVEALIAGLETEIAFWDKSGRKHAHPSDRHIVEESLQAKKRLYERLKKFLEYFPSREDEES